MAERSHQKQASQTSHTAKATDINCNASNIKRNKHKQIHKNTGLIKTTADFAITVLLHLKCLVRERMRPIYFMTKIPPLLPSFIFL